MLRSHSEKATAMHAESSAGETGFKLPFLSIFFSKGRIKILLITIAQDPNLSSYRPGSHWTVHILTHGILFWQRVVKWQKGWQLNNWNKPCLPCTLFGDCCSHFQQLRSWSTGHSMPLIPRLSLSRHELKKHKQLMSQVKLLFLFA